MSLIQVLDQEGNNFALLDISETGVPDNELESVIRLTIEKFEDWEEELECSYGIQRVYVSNKMEL